MFEPIKKKIIKKNNKKKFKNLVRNGLIMFFRKPQLCWSVQCAYRYKISLKLNMKFQHSISKKVLKNLQHSTIELGHFKFLFYRSRVRKEPRCKTHMQNHCFVRETFCLVKLLVSPSWFVSAPCCFCTGRKINQQRHYNWSRRIIIVLLRKAFV